MIIADFSRRLGEPTEDREHDALCRKHALRAVTYYVRTGPGSLYMRIFRRSLAARGYRLPVDEPVLVGLPRTMC